MIGQLADLLLHGGIDEIQISHQLAIAGLINDSLQKAAHEAGVLGHGVRFFRAFPELGSKGDRHDCDKWPDVELKRSSRQDGFVRCEGLRRWFRRNGAIKELEQLATDLLELLHLLLLRQVGAFRQPFTNRGEAPMHCYA